MDFKRVRFLSDLMQHACDVFFFQAEDGIRDIGVTGVQTCALPIYYNSQKLTKDNKIYIKDFNDAEYCLTVGGLKLMDYHTQEFIRVISFNEYDKINNKLDEILIAKLN